MKRIINGLWMGSLIGILFVGTSWVVRAEEEGSMMGNEKGGVNQVEKMKEKLGLSDSQASKLKDLFKKQREDMTPLRDQMKIDMDTLQQKVDMKAPDSEIKKLLDKLDADRKGMESGREKMKDQLRAILSPTQQAKLVLGMRSKGMEMMGKRTKHRKDRMNKGKDQTPIAPSGEKDSGAGK